MDGTFDDVRIERLRARRTVKWSLYGPDVLAAWVAEMDFDVAPAVRAALVDAVEREDFGYVPGDLRDVAEACCDFFAERYGWSVSPNRVFLLADVLTGIATAFDLHVAPGKPIVVLTPAYPPFFDIVALGGRAVVEVPLIDADGVATLDLDRIEAALTAGAGGVLLCNPHNPTGRAFTAAELTALAEAVDRHGARVVADEVHGPLVYDRAHIPYATVSDAAADHSVTVVSASKAFNVAGMKCAQVVTTNHADASTWRKVPLFQIPGPTPLGLAATVAAYHDSGAWLDGLVAYLDGNRRALGDLLAERLPGVRYRLPDATYLTWLDCADLGHRDPARFFLDEAKVALSDGSAFGTGFDQHVRLNIGTSRAMLEKIVDAMAEAQHRSR